MEWIEAHGGEYLILCISSVLSVSNNIPDKFKSFVNIREKEIVNWIFVSFSFQIHSIHIFFRRLMFKTPFPPRVPIVISAYLTDVQIN